MDIVTIKYTKGFFNLASGSINTYLGSSIRAIVDNFRH
jgi:hypothetical protein